LESFPAHRVEKFN